jgi:hypothetical protein
MKNIRYILAGLIVFMMQVSLANTEVLSDNEIKQKIIRFIAPVCAESMIDGELIDTYYINGNTNRLLRILSDMVKTNDEWICTQTMFEYSKYATKSELPFLYSCATNSMCGDRALNTIISLDGISSNLLQTVGQYFSITNGFSVDDDANRSRFAEDLLKRVYRTESLFSYRERVFNMTREFALNVNLMHVSVDKALMRVDPTYENSKRRLNVMRGAKERCISDFLTNYVTNVINKLEMYPEENLPD